MGEQESIILQEEIVKKQLVWEFENIQKVFVPIK